MSFSPRRKRSRSSRITLRRAKHPSVCPQRFRRRPDDAFLDWVQKNRKADTSVWYHSRLPALLDRYPDLMANHLKPIHVQQWIDSFEVASGTKRMNYSRSITRCMAWCMAWCGEHGLNDRSPIRHFKKLRERKREQVITDDQYQKILTSIDRPCWHHLRGKGRSWRKRAATG